jgi:tetratricopeptide (TPR) repeat protein
MTPDPYESYLLQAEALFAQGEVVKAGQIWQAILKQQPTHAEARERLMAVRARLQAIHEREAGEPAPHPEPPPEDLHPSRPSNPDSERLLADGCTLYDMGQLEDALLKWEELLRLNPNHALAQGYANGARRELGRATAQLPAAEPAPSTASLAPPAEEDTDKLQREAVQLYDMGLVEEAIAKWERLLALEPHRQEIQAYLHQARAEAGRATLITPAVQDRESLDLKLRQAEHLLILQRHEEAAFTFQQALGLAPGNVRALQGLARCQRSDQGEGRAPSQPVDSSPPNGNHDLAHEDITVVGSGQGVEPPALLLKATPAPREGLYLPEGLRETAERLPWLKEPRRLAAIGGGLLALIAASALIHNYRKDQALKDEVRAARAAATAPLAQEALAVDLVETPAAIRQEAETTLVTDPLRAYMRAQALLARDPADASAGILLEKARAGLPGGVSGASLGEFEKHLQSGNLEGATKVMEALLRAQPDDAALRLRACRLQLALCTIHAAQAKWEAAQEDLLRGRALQPGDKSWQIRLQLLERVKALPKAQQAGWIPLLG